MIFLPHLKNVGSENETLQMEGATITVTRESPQKVVPFVLDVTVSTKPMTDTFGRGRVIIYVKTKRFRDRYLRDRRL